MSLLTDYLKNPCRTASIPYWKQKNIQIPGNMKIVHDSEYNAAYYAGYSDDPYFRLYHDLKNITQPTRKDVEFVCRTDTLDIFVDIINKSYTDLSVTKEQMESYR